MRKLVTIFLFIVAPLASIYAQNQVRENLGKNINTECYELSPVISPDGKTLYFTRSECAGNTGKEDIWVSHLQPDSTWSKAVNMGSPLNNKGNNFVSWVSPDGNTLLLGSIYDTTGLDVKEGVSITSMGEKGWETPQGLIIEDYYNLNQSNGFCMNSEGNILLMTVERMDSFGKKDIYVSFLQSNGLWTAPKNIGAQINTKEDEISPYLAHDGISLYFSSTGHGGYGNADVFVSRRLDDSWTNWSEPKNLGAGINTPEWDAFFKLTALGDYAYFVSNKSSYGKSDIYRIKIPETFRPRVVILVKGRVVNAKTKMPISTQVSFIPEGKDSVQKSVAKSNLATGEYAVTLLPARKYQIRGKIDGFKEFESSIDLSKDLVYREIIKNIELVPNSDSLIFLPNIFFKSGQIQPDDSTAQTIQRISDFLKKNADYTIVVSGFADNKGGEQKNIDLSRQRAEKVKEYFISIGTPENQIETVAMGQNDPIASNDTDEGRALNRRVELSLKKNN